MAVIRRIVGGVRRRWSYLSQRRRLKAFYRPLVTPGDLCFDIGANEGQWTRVFLSLGARVVAVEPQPEVCSRFLNPLPADIENVAVGATSGRVTLHLARESSGVAHINPQWQEGPFSYMTWDRRITVPLVTLDSLIDRYGIPDVCKIDVEGYETEVLKGLSVPIKLISFEYQGAFPHIARECFGLLDSLGDYEANFMVGDSGSFIGEWRHPTEILTQLLAQTKDAPSMVGDVFMRERRHRDTHQSGRHGHSITTLRVDLDT